MKSELLKKIQLVVLAIVVLIVISGCKKTESAKPQGEASSASAVVEQTICPVMGGKIDPNVFTEYKGKKVYFCCSSCEGEFEKNPEKYVSQLPQFAK